jgi:hypothetical protein
MKLLLVLLLIGLAGCSGFVFVSNLPATGATSVVGFVSIVQLGTVVHDGAFVSVTFVTFLHSGTATNLTFCGNVASQFPLNTNLRVDFVSTAPCSTTQVVIII